MRWRQGRQSTNVEDRRGRGGMSARGIGTIGKGGVGVLVLALIAYALGADPRMLLALLSGGDAGSYTATETPGAAPPADDEGAAFVSAVLADTEDVWRELLPALGRPYQDPKLVLFNGMVRSACGFQDSAVGPFYCPGDSTVYLDLSFFHDLATRFGAEGDFAQAYVIGHEVGHHVQNLLGISGDVHRRQQALSESGANALSVRLELQADFFAGVWAHHAQRARGMLEPGDLEEALAAAAAIGDDRLQRRARGTVVPESFTHGTSEQRVRWFRKGFTSGDPNSADPFQVDEP